MPNKSLIQMAIGSISRPDIIMNRHAYVAAHQKLKRLLIQNYYIHMCYHTRTPNIPSFQPSVN